MLVGIDDDKKELVMNLVDWIGTSFAVALKAF